MAPMATTYQFEAIIQAFANIIFQQQAKNQHMFHNMMQAVGNGARQGKGPRGESWGRNTSVGQWS